MPLVRDVAVRLARAKRLVIEQKRVAVDPLTWDRRGIIRLRHLDGT